MACVELLGHPWGKLEISVVLEVLKLLFGVWDDGVCARLPSSGTHLAVLVGVLEGLDQAQRLVHAAAHRQVVHGDLAESALGVNDEEAPESVSVLREVDAVVAGDLVREVGEQGDVQPAQASLCSGSVHPGQVGEVRVHATGHNLDSKLPELLDSVVEGQDLGGADEGEIKGVEEEDEVLARVV